MTHGPPFWTNRQHWWEQFNSTVTAYHLSETSGSYRARTWPDRMADRDATDCAISLPLWLWEKVSELCSKEQHEKTHPTVFSDVSGMVPTKTASSPAGIVAGVIVSLLLIVLIVVAVIVYKVSHLMKKAQRHQWYIYNRGMEITCHNHVMIVSLDSNTL